MMSGSVTRLWKRGIVVSTPSTVALDVLKLGVLPLLYAGSGLDPHSAIAQLPLQADSAEGLRICLDNCPERSAAFALAWSRVAPGREPTLADIRGLLDA